MAATATAADPTTGVKNSREEDNFNIIEPPTGEILGSFGSFTLGLIWSLPNVRDTDMLTTIPVYHMLEEKVYYSLNLETNEQFTDPTIVEIFKVEDCHDVHIRAINSGNYKTDQADPLNMISPEDFVFSASIVNSSEKILRQEKLCKSYMAGARKVGKRCWEIPSFIPASEFDKNLLTPSGDLHLRLTFEGKILNAPSTVTETSVGETSNTNNLGQVSKSNANVTEKIGICEEKVSEKILAHNVFAELALGGFPTRINHLRTRGKFADGSIIVTQPGKPKRTFPIHRNILAAQSPGFEAAFEVSQDLNLENYSVRSIEVLLNYMYTGELVCDRRTSVLTELIEVGEEMQVVGLKDRCLEIVLETDKTIAGGINSYNLGIKHNSSLHKLNAMKIFEEHKDVLMESQDFKQFVRENKLEVLFFPMFE